MGNENKGENKGGSRGQRRKTTEDGSGLSETEEDGVGLDGRQVGTVEGRYRAGKMEGGKLGVEVRC